MAKKLFYVPAIQVKLRIIVPVLLLLLSGSMSSGYPTYHDPNLDGQGYCAQCHPGFIGGKNDTLHALHTGGSDPVTGECGLCHVQQGDLPVTMYSAVGLGCMGCHGRDYGQTIVGNYEGHTIAGNPKNSGVGLRKRHNAMLGNMCAGCHPSDPEPYPENVINPGLGNTVHYYLLLDSKGNPVATLGDEPLDPSSNEDSGNDADTTGLDNDGDFLWDMNDPDSVGNPSQVFIAQLESGMLRISWPTPSPGWVLQGSPDLQNNWIDLPSPAINDRQMGFWHVDVDPATDTNRFFRATDTSVAAASAAVGQQGHSRKAKSQDK